MRRRRVRLKKLFPIVCLLLPPLFWAAVLTLTPTNWARKLLVTRIAEETGRSVKLGGLRLGVLGGVYLIDLEIGSNPSTVDQTPWLKAALARVDVSVAQLLVGQFAPSRIQVNGLSVRVLRREDGSLELADFLRRRPSKRQSEEDGGDASSFTLDIEFRNSELTIDDRPSGAKLDIQAIRGTATWAGRQLLVHQIQGTLNGGEVELALGLDRTEVEPSFDARVRVEGVGLEQDASLLAYLTPVLAGVNEQNSPLGGKVDLSLQLRGQGATRSALSRTMLGQGYFKFHAMAMERSPIYQELRKRITLPDRLQSGSAEGAFKVQNGRIESERLTLELDQLPIVLNGYTDFDGRLDYQIHPDTLENRLPADAKVFLNEVGIETGDLKTLRLHGDVSHLQLSGGSEKTSRMVGGAQNDRERFRQIGRRVRDRVFR